MLQRYRAFIVLVALSFLIYLPFLRNQLVWDDEQFIYNNAYVREFRVDKLLTENTIAGAGEQSNYYRPLTSISLALDYQFWQTNPIGFHLTNLLLHTTAGLLLFSLLQALGLSRQASFWISAAFLAHPAQVEAVTYANSRGDSMYAVFGMASLLSFTRLLQSSAFKLNIYNLRFHFSSLFLACTTLITYIAAILGKEIGIAILGLHVLILLRFAILKKNKWKWLRSQKIPIAALLGLICVAICYLLLRMTALNFVNSFNFYGNSESLYAQSLVVRVLTFSKIIWIYLQILVFPYPLHMERDTSLVQTALSPWPWLSLSMVVTVASAGWHEWRLRNSTWIWFGAGWATIMLAPVSGLIPINGLLYEHWLYTPLIGLAVLLYGVMQLVKFSPPKSLGISIVIIWILFSWRQNHIWSTPERLYTHILTYAQTGRIHNNLAMAYAESGKHELAEKEYQAALKISDHYPQIYFNLANTYVAQKKWELAITNYQAALALNPNFEPAYPRLILLYAQEGDLAVADQLFADWQNVSNNTSDQENVQKYLESLN